MTLGGAWLLAVGWVNPLALGGLALVALPIIIHLLSRRQFRRVPWGAMVFLLQAERENRRRTRFEQWLLLALRCAAMCLLALLIARPFVQPGAVAALLGSGGGGQRIVLIDDSASLGYRSGDRTDFETLRNAAERLVRWLSREAAGDRLILFRTGAADEPLLDTTLGAVTLAETQRAIRTLRAGQTPARPRRALETIADLIKTAGAAHSDVYILSDFQRSEWLGAAEQGDSPLATLRAAGDRDARVVFVAAGAARRDNVAVVSVEPERRRTIAGFPAVFRARVANYGAAAASGLRLQIDVDGAPAPAQELDPLEPGEARIVPFEITAPDAGFVRLVASLSPGDAFPIDDAFRVTVRAAESLRVMIVNGQPATDPSRDETYFLRNALAPPGPASSGMRLEVVDPIALERESLREFDCVLVCNAPVSEVAAERLHRYVSQGGGLALFPGDQVSAAEWNHLLIEQYPLAPARLEGVRTAAGADEFVGLLRVAEHAVTSALGGESATSEAVRFRRFFRLRVEPREGEPSSPAGGRSDEIVLARFSDAAGSPAIIERRVGDGRVLLFAFPADLDWHNWPRAVDGSFVVAMLETVQSLARRDLDALSAESGGRLVAHVDADRYQTHAMIVPPDYPERPKAAARVTNVGADVDAPLALAGPDADRVGYYELELETREGESVVRPLAVNLPPQESQLAIASAGELAPAISGVPHEYIRAGESFGALADESRRELWPALLAALLAILMAEQACAWWFGRIGAAPRAGVRAARGVEGRRAPSS